MSVTTRHDPHRARAGSGRRPPTKTASARTTQRSPKPPVRTARPVRTTRPVRPARSQPATPARRPSSTGTGARPRPHRPPAKVARLPVSRPRRAWAGGTFQRRIRLVRLVLVVAMLLLVARLVDVQVLHAGAYEAAARGESSITVSLPSLRGGIYARDGAPLAMSVPTDDVVADDFQVAHPVQTALALSPMLDIPATTLASQLHRPSGYVVLARQLPQSLGQKISADAFPGITMIADSKRIVPNGNLAGPVIGFTNAAGHGAAGLEYGDNRCLGGNRRQGDDHGVAGGCGVATVTRREPGPHVTRDGSGAHARHRAPVRVGASLGGGDRVISRREWHSGADGRQDGPGPLHGQSRRHPPQCTCRDDRHDPSRARRGRADRSPRCGGRGVRQPRRQPALRAGVGVQARHLFGGAGRTA